MKYLRQLKSSQLKNKTCLLRVDLNIEIGGKEAFRLQAILPTIKFLLKNGAKVVILSHRGRPLETKNLKTLPASRQVKTKSHSLKPFAGILSRLLKKTVNFVEEKPGSAVAAKIKKSLPGTIFLLENLRFLPEEEKNDSKFAKSLAALGDIYINDAFAVSHRANASVEAITRFIPSYAGFLLEKEVENLDSVMKGFKKPLIVILGGAKVSDKIGLINNFLTKADYFLIGGAMANTFFASQGLPVGDSFYEKEIDLNSLMSKIDKQIILPIDAVIYKKMILDIGPETIKKYGEIIKKAKTIIWNGPMGKFEDKEFAKATEGIAEIILQNKTAKIVIGGGETTAAFQAANLKFKIRNSKLFLSTGGGAMLEYLAGKKLPGIEALK